MPLPQKGLRNSEEVLEMRLVGRDEEMNMTEERGRELKNVKKPEERFQDFLMPGLRHAHTLQQLRVFIEYSPPGEYLNKQTNKPRLK